MIDELKTVAQTAESVEEKKDCGCGCKGAGNCKGHDDEGKDQHWILIGIAIAVVGVVGFAFGWWSKIASIVKKQIA